MKVESPLTRLVACAALLPALAAITLTLPGCAVAMLSGAAGGGVATSSKTPPPSSQAATDDAISTAVRAKLRADPALKPFNITVDTHDGVVTLKGQVSKVGQRQAAELGAHAVNGVKSVKNQVTVRN